MWLPLELTLEYLGRSAAFLAVMVGFALAAGCAAVLAARRPLRSAWPGPVLGGLLGALLGASLCFRFGWPAALSRIRNCLRVMFAGQAAVPTLRMNA